ncbi:2-hydroxy-6-oxononadienedioate/2-hydroxy-6-oxononatrienedioate hydrolase [Streptomyces hirsutus]
MALTEEQEIKVPGLLSRFVRLQSGVKAHYSTSGEAGPAVVLLHGGIPGSSGSAGFRYMAPFLGAQGFRVYCPDFPGFGLTEDPGRFYAYGQGGQVDYLQDFVNAVALDTFCLGGNSMGCQTSVNYVVAHPERVERFAVIAGMIGDLVTRDEMRAVDNRAKQGPLPGSGGTYDGVRDLMRPVEHFTPEHRLRGRHRRPTSRWATRRPPPVLLSEAERTAAVDRSKRLYG